MSYQLEQKIDKLFDKIVDVEKILVSQETLLMAHDERTRNTAKKLELLEADILPIKNGVRSMQFIVKALLVAATVYTAINKAFALLM